MTTLNYTYIKQNLDRVNAFIFQGNRTLCNSWLMEFGIGSLTLRNPKDAPSSFCVIEVILQAFPRYNSEPS